MEKLEVIIINEGEIFPEPPFHSISNGYLSPHIFSIEIPSPLVFNPKSKSSKTIIPAFTEFGSHHLVFGFLISTYSSRDSGIVILAR